MSNVVFIVKPGVVTMLCHMLLSNNWVACNARHQPVLELKNEVGADNLCFEIVERGAMPAGCI